MPPNTIRTNSELDALKEIVRLLKEQTALMQIQLTALQQIVTNTN